MPSSDYRLWEEDITKEARRSPGGSIVEDNTAIDDLDYYDDFVIIDRVDMKRYNEPTKLLEEEKIKDSGSS